jgi:hypothetical protein
MSEFLGKVAAGAALGSALGPVGAGAGAAAAIVVELADATGLSRWLFGPGAAETRAAVAQAVEAATGTAEPAAQAAALAGDPAAAARLREALARIAAQRETERDAAQLDALRAALADTQSARAQTLDLARAGSALAWGAPIVSVITLLSYGIISTLAVWLTSRGDLPPNAVAVLSLVLGAASSMAAAVVSYWVGSSAGSAKKSEQLERMTTPPK